jgi:hypothetical protein
LARMCFVWANTGEFQRTLIIRIFEIDVFIESISNESLTL